MRENEKRRKGGQNPWIEVRVGWRSERRASERVNQRNRMWWQESECSKLRLT